MKNLLWTTALAGVMLAAAPGLALAQSSGQQQQTAQQGQGGQAQAMAMSQESLRSALESAGFSNIQIVDATYLVRAQSPDGEQVVMFLDPPPQMAQAGGTSGQQQGSGQQASGQGGSSLQASYTSFKESDMDTSSTVAGDMTADELLDSDVADQSGNSLGTVHDLLVGQDDEVQAALIETSDGNRVAVSIDRLQFEEGAGEGLTLDMSQDELSQQPTYEQQGQDWQRQQG